MKKIILIISLLSLIFCSCSISDTFEEPNAQEIITQETESIEIPDWTDETHSKNVDPNYDIVFNQNEVLEFNIVIDSNDWETMQNDLEENLSQTSREMGPPPGNTGVQNTGMEDNTMSEVSDYDPVWVPSSFNFNDTEWYKVGIRFKGNSSLSSAYSQGNGKLSFKLDFDEFEDTYPDIKNQRFYGFKQLNLNNNFDDESLMREKVASDLFRDFGLVSAQTTFCIVNVDYGEGSKYFGLYTLVEEIDDTAIETQLGDDSGNLYKPDGDAAAFSEGSYDEDELVKKSNEDEEDYTDVRSLYDILNSDDRTDDAETWKSNLESVLNVNVFLKWLAANTTMQNWDTYGNMTHNYYLYNNPSTGLLNWIPWDNNEALQDGKGTLYNISLDGVSKEWPLIRYILNDSAYKATYNSYVEEFIDTVFTIEDLQATYTTYYNLIKEYAYSEIDGYTYLSSDSSFDNAVETLKDHVETRNSTAKDYLND